MPKKKKEKDIAQSACAIAIIKIFAKFAEPKQSRKNGANVLGYSNLMNIFVRIAVEADQKRLKAAPQRHKPRGGLWPFFQAITKCYVLKIGL
jgi:hypothetical protein